MLLPMQEEKEEDRVEAAGEAGPLLRSDGTSQGSDNRLSDSEYRW